MTGTVWGDIVGHVRRTLSAAVPGVASLTRATVLCLVLTAGPAFAADRLRIGVQTTGTFAWQLDVIARHDLAKQTGLDLEITPYASVDASKLALNSGTVDVVVTDWLWVARERALGRKIKFYPYSTAVGAIMVKADSPLHDIAGLKGRSLSVAGGALDKSWLIVRAAAQRRGLDLARDVTLMYGAPPLLFAKLRQGEPDAGLNYWNFCARLEAQGYRRLYDVGAAEQELGLAQPIAMIGYAFPDAFAAAHPGTIDRFLAAASQADQILRESDGEWEALRPLMAAESNAVFESYRATFRATLPRADIGAEAADAQKLFEALAAIGGTDLVGPSRQLDEGLYYRPSSSGN
jgi:NitT/TauT family transport system substrate-binding protein